MSSIRLFIFLVSLAAFATAKKFHFDTTGYQVGTFIPLPKNKHGAEKRGEDSMLTSPYSLVVADGVGGCHFSSKHISSFLAHVFQLAVTKKVQQGLLDTKDDFPQFITGELHDGIRVHTNLLKEYVGEWTKSTKKQIPFDVSEMSSSTTFVAATIINTESGPKLRVTQKGDSLLTIFRLMESQTRPGSYYYLPIFTTKDQQYSFNFPYQFNSFVKNDADEIYHKLVDIKANDLVVIGSDGLFDNMHMGYMTMVLNTMAAYPMAVQDEQLEKLKAIQEVYLELLKSKRWVLEEFYAHGNIYGLGDENNFTEKPESTTGRYFYSIWKKYISTGTRDRIEAGKPDAYRAKVDKIVEEKLANVASISQEELSSWKAYFMCPVLKMVSMPAASGQSAKIIRDCVRRVLDQQVAAPPSTLKSFVALNPKTKSLIIANLVKLLAVNVDYYPSPFRLHSWNEGNAVPSVYGGKDDDISVVVATVRNSIHPYDGDTPSSFVEIFEGYLKSSLNDMKADVDAFLNFFWKLANIEVENIVIEGLPKLEVHLNDNQSGSKPAADVAVQNPSNESPSNLFGPANSDDAIMSTENNSPLRIKAVQESDKTEATDDVSQVTLEDTSEEELAALQREKNSSRSSTRQSSHQMIVV